MLLLLLVLLVTANDVANAVAVFGVGGVGNFVVGVVVDASVAAVGYTVAAAAALADFDAVAFFALDAVVVVYRRCSHSSISRGSS